jgi:hypothetical protein
VHPLHISYVFFVVVEQQANMKLKSWENSCTETYNVLTSVSVNGTGSHTEVFEWFQRFQEGCENLKG